MSSLAPQMHKAGVFHFLLCMLYEITRCISKFNNPFINNLIIDEIDNVDSLCITLFGYAMLTNVSYVSQ